MQAGSTGRTARAVYRACALAGATEPYDRLSLKIYYPALPDDGAEQRNAGIVPVDPSDAPYPVVIIMPGINVGPEGYGWLAEELVLQGFVAVTYTMIAEEMPGYVSLTPGLDLAAVTPETWGKQPSASALPAILEAIRVENDSGVLGGHIDCDNVVLAGHSGGGSVALFNANQDWFPAVRGAISYGAHAAASTMLGFESDTVLQLPGRLPLMIIGGTRDGVIAESGHRYGVEERDPLYLMRRTFEESVSPYCKVACLVQIEGANHFSMAHPLDATTGRPFLDWPEEGDSESIRSLLAFMIVEFASFCTGRAGADITRFEGNKLLTISHREALSTLSCAGASDV